MTKKIEKFSPEVCKELDYYVYRLIDPRNGETFYVGKGKDNRVFEHVKQALKLDKDEDEITVKYDRIQEIKNSGLDVIHIIHRHGMNEKTAFEVESALIDAYPGLTNLQNGFDSERGAMHVFEIKQKYAAEIAEFAPAHKLLIININRSFSAQRSAYEAAHLAWKLDPYRAKKADFVLAVEKGIIVDILEVDEINGEKQWLKATPEHFPELTEERKGRFGFKGKPTTQEDIRKLYNRKRLPEAYRKPGASNPIKYSYK